ncbi:hypothetical protein OVA11_06030 [Caulobacter sp. SL161]|uniref:hypothetical protein n=1 Tax=Caulobacter sp. SL161 TaxID=2995156 RepID=UPI0022757801|nr:hypothetical protein [Caulobacter sp. SL161]MCY1646647.1 hypothetical protein [Caulobacter sp. SL161]
MSTRRGYATAVLTSVVQAFEGKASPVFIPALFISLFTLMVLIVRPWTIQGQSAAGETRLVMPNDPETDAAGLDA